MGWSPTKKLIEYDKSILLSLPMKAGEGNPQGLLGLDRSLAGIPRIWGLEFHGKAATFTFPKGAENRTGCNNLQGCVTVGQVVQDLPGVLGPTGTKGSKAADNQDNASAWGDGNGPHWSIAQGHVYALVMQLHQVAQAIPLKDVTAKSVAGALLLLILMWGPPAELLTNQGPEFVAKLNCKLLRQWGIKRQYATAWDVYLLPFLYT